jgi:hypothetical protein
MPLFGAPVRCAMRPEAVGILMAKSVLRLAADDVEMRFL